MRQVADVTLARIADRCPNLVGFKDAVGDIEMMTRIYSRLGDRLTCVGGLPTAEKFSLPKTSIATAQVHCPLAAPIPPRQSLLCAQTKIASEKSS